jgi:hypothetical protein
MTRAPAPVRAGAWTQAAAAISNVLCALLMAGCAGTLRAPERAPQPEASAVAAPYGAQIPVEPSSASSAPSSAPPKAVSAAREPLAVEPKVPQAAPTGSGPPHQGAAKPVASAPKAQPPPAVAARAPKNEAPAAAVAKPAPPPALDLKSLETRLKETNAIGVFTKLTLKNQVDDLLDRFRGFYQGRIKTSLAELRHAYDLLVLKVLALLQDADPPLATAIAASRESIWGILSNPTKFSAI